MLKIIIDGPFRHVHCGATGHHIDTLVMERNGRNRLTGKFVLLDAEKGNGKTLREWKAQFARYLNANFKR